MNRIHLLILLAVACSVRADVVELRDGRILKGTYQGGTAGTLRLDTGSGIEVLPIEDVLALTIDRRPGSSEVAKPMAATTQTVAPTGGTVPAGSDVVVRLRSRVGTSNMRAGSKFEATLVNDLRDGSIIIAPQGSIVRGTVTDVRRPRRLIKSALLAATLDEIVVGNQLLRISTDALRAETGNDGAIVRGAIRGAIIGEIAGKDAGDGAAAGAGLAALKRGNDIDVPPGTVITFRLSAPLRSP